MLELIAANWPVFLVAMLIGVATAWWVWARYAIARDDGSLIMVTNSGNVREEKDGSWTGHTVAKLEAGADDLRWLNTAIVVGSLKAAADGSGVVLEWWTVG